MEEDKIHSPNVSSGGTMEIVDIERPNEENEYSENVEPNTSVISNEIENSEDIEAISTVGTVINDITSNSETAQNTTKKNQVDKQKLVQLPLSKVKMLMQMDPDCRLISKDAVFLTVKATELFLQLFARESFKFTQLSKRKTMSMKDVDNAIDNVSSLCFLDGTLELCL